MQKNRLFLLAKEWLVRGIFFGLAFIATILLTLFGASVYAQTNPGGRLGEILNRILASGNWQIETGPTITVKNANQLGGSSASAYVKLTANRSCLANQCVTGFDVAGNVQCR